jgi:tape measure domain-containing protein
MALDVRSRYLIDAKVSGQGGLDSFGRSLKSVSKEGGAASTVLKGTAATIAEIAAGAGLAIGISEITGQMIQFGRSSIESSLNLERLGVQLKFATGSAAGAADTYRYLRELTNGLGLDFDATSRAFAKFAAAAKGTSLEGEETRRIFESVAQAAAVMQLSAADTEGVFLALSQMLSKGKVSAEELRGQLGERLPGAFKIAADAIGVSTAQLDKMLQSGEVVADDFLPKFGRQLRETFAGDVAESSDTASAAINRLSNEWEKFKASVASSDAVKSVADVLRQMLVGAQAELGLDPVLEARLKLKRANEELLDSYKDYLAADREARATAFPSPQQIAELEAQSDRVIANENAVRDLTRAYNELAGVQTGPSRSTSDVRELEGRGKQRLEALRGEYAAFMEDFATKSQKAAKEIDAFRARFEGALKPEQLAAGIAAIRNKYKETATVKRDADADAIEAAERQLNTTRELTNVEQTRFEIERGRYAALKPETQARLLALAEERDLVESIKENTSELARIEEAEARERQRAADELERRRAAVEREIEDIHNQAAAYGMSAKEAAEFAFQVDLIEQGFAAGSVEFNNFVAQYRAGIAELEERQGNWALGARAALKDYADAASDVAGQTYDFVSDQFAGLEEVAANFSRTGKFAFKDFALSAVADLNRIILRVTTLGPLANFLAGLFGNPAGAGGTTLSTGGALSISSLGSLFGGAFAGGGRTQGGRAYLVGEEGPELFVPGGSGSVVPNGAMGGISISVVVNQNGESTQANVQSNDADGHQFGERLAGAVRAVVLDESRAGGVIDRIVSQGRR